MKRIYQSVIEEHLESHQQMVILEGPRASGKTCLLDAVKESVGDFVILDWCISADRELILAGPEKIYSKINHASQLPIVAFDNLYLYKEWKNLLKGYYDVLSGRCKLIIIMAEKTDVYRTGQDSMMGRYFSYHIHPYSVAELCGRSDFTKEYVPPQKLSEEVWNNLFVYGGFPEVFNKSKKAFHATWQNNFRNSIIKHDIRELSKINNSQLLDLLSQILIQSVGEPLNFSRIARNMQSTTPSVQSWYQLLLDHYYGFMILPWSKDIKRTIRKAPKFYLYDWSQHSDTRLRIENLVACHLKKFVEFFTDIGLGNYSLHYIRDKEHRGVDFLVAKDDKPWMIIDVKKSNKMKINSFLLYFYKQLDVQHTFQLVFDMEYIDKDCFSVNSPVIVPVITFLSQLI